MEPQGPRRLGGAPGEIGSYQIAQDVRQLLIGQRFGLPVTPLVPAGVTSLWQGAAADQSLSIYGLEVIVGIDLAVGVADGWPSDSTPGHGLAGGVGGLGVGDLDIVHIDWASTTPIPTPTPGDGNALAIDQIVLNPETS